MAARKGGAPATPKAPERITAPLSPKAPRIMVTDSQRSVEWHVEASGGLPIRASYTAEAAVRDLASCDGLLITGGGDVNPALYGHQKHRSVYGLTSSRDLRELALLGAARTLGIPVLGICRGLQIIAVEAGGTLWQHLPDRLHHDEHSFSMMPVRTVRGSVVAKALGEQSEQLHLHHQSVRRVPKGYRISARHSDGTVEAIESHDGRVIGVQFHPESTIGAPGGHNGHKLFELFVSAASRYRRRANANGRTVLRPAETYTGAWPVAQAAYHSAYITWKPEAPAAPKAPKPKTQQPPKGKRFAVVESRDTGTGGVQSLRLEPVGYCRDCGVAFDWYSDWQDHEASGICR